MVLNPVVLREHMPQRLVEWHHSLPSTMHRASLLAKEGAPHGSIVGADEQTQGEGRMGRTWHSAAGDGLYFTLLLRPELPPRDSPMLTLCLGLAVAEAISRSTPFRCDLRWPNDVLIHGRKVCGILVKYEDGAFLAGIGVNLDQQQFPDGLNTPATSLALEGFPQTPREPFLQAIAQLVDSYLDMLAHGGKSAILETFHLVSSYARGKLVDVDFGSHTERGVTDGLNEDGYLWLRLPSGERRLVVAGGVRPVAT